MRLGRLIEGLPDHWQPWFIGLRFGDFCLVALAIVGVVQSFNVFWKTEGAGEWVQIRRNGDIFAELDLHTPRQIAVSGPLGQTTIEVSGGRARVVSDPGPRQYCVRQGWLSRNGEVAICAPNQVSLQITGRTKAYDSLAY